MRETTMQCPWCDGEMQMSFDHRHNKHIATCEKCKLDLASATLEGVDRLVKEYYDKRIEAQSHEKK